MERIVTCVVPVTPENHAMAGGGALSLTEPSLKFTELLKNLHSLLKHL